MKSFLKSKKGIACIAAAVLILAAAGFGSYGYWYAQQPKFHDLTVELGVESIGIADFMTEYAKGSKVGFVSDPSDVDLNRVGKTELTLSHGRAEETVTLTVADTTAPAVEFVTERYERIDYVPVAEDFVTSVEDESETRVYFEYEPKLPKDYSDVTVSVVVEDASGNKVQRDCTLSYAWMQESYALEYGNKLTKKDLLLDPERDSSLLDQNTIDEINNGGIGEYTITSTLGDKTMTCAVTVADTKGPELELKNVQIGIGGWANLNSFVVSYSDVSGDVEVRLMSELDVYTESKQTIAIEAEDIHGNITRKEATLWVATDFTAPWISGANGDLSVEKNSEPDFLEGVTANDNKIGACEVTCDTSKLDMTKAGTYYITYSASDNSGNTATVKRKVVVEHDEEDTAALVKSIADTLSDDPEQIRNYVRSSIGYTTNWGGDDPVWHGFTTRGGNCYVHALCLKAIFDEKGIESQLIWVSNKTHYWLIVNIDGVWKHIDATPSTLHSRYSLMNDAQRYSTLSGRNWDRDQWPACE